MTKIINNGKDIQLQFYLAIRSKDFSIRFFKTNNFVKLHDEKVFPVKIEIPIIVLRPTEMTLLIKPQDDGSLESIGSIERIKELEEELNRLRSEE